MLPVTSLCGILLLLPAFVVSTKIGPIKDAYYKIVNLRDGTVLTATMSRSRPRVVITAPWIGAAEQEWKVKTKIVGNDDLQIIRNEKIRDNEVTKELNRDKAANKLDYVQTLWNLITLGKLKGVGGFELNTGVACLKGNGAGKEIEYVPCIDSNDDLIDPSYLWRFEYLYDIPSSDATID